MHYLVIDDRFPSPVYVFLDTDPRREDGFPGGLPVHRVTLERRPEQGGPAWADGATTTSVGRHLGEPALFIEFGSDGAVAAAGCQLVEPRYVGPTWKAYARYFRPGGKAKR